MTKDDFADKISLYIPQMYRFALSIVKNEADAQDVVAESVKIAYEQLNKLKYKAKFESWMMSIVSNEAKDLISKNKREQLTDDIRIFEKSGNDEKDEMLQIVMMLPEEFSKVVMLYYYDGFSTREIAMILHISVGTVKSRLSRAREKLKTMIEI